jgi:hypothetical protein
MKLLDGSFAEFNHTDFADGGLKSVQTAGSFESSQRQVRGESARLARNALRIECILDGGGKRGELRAGFHARPQNAGSARIREKSKAAKI